MEVSIIRKKKCFIFGRRKKFQEIKKEGSKMVKLNKEEKEILNSVEKGEWKSIKNKEKEIPRYQKITAFTFKKDKNINLRISKKDLDGLRERALEEGIHQQINQQLEHFENKGITEM